jgi:NADPH:quinone reductase-like Zn-dependent oxidoreductase
MTGPVVLVTGALTGIGRATALAFAKTGARVAVSGRRAAEGQVLERDLQQLGADAVFFAADVRHDEEVGRPVGPYRKTGRHRQLRAVPRVGPGGVHYRSGDHRRRRQDRGLIRLMRAEFKEDVLA